MIRNYDVFETNGKYIKAWTKGVQFDDKAKHQVFNIAKMPFIHGGVAVMPDVHVGVGATIGSVIPTIDAIIPAAVGVDIGCGMMAVKTSLNGNHLEKKLPKIRAEIERLIPHGRSTRGADRGAWNQIPNDVSKRWRELTGGLENITAKHPEIAKSNSLNHLGTLGTGNHFIELCVDEYDDVWFMLHSGSRGVGNKIGRYFIEKAKEDMRIHHINLPDRDLSYLSEGTEHFEDYVEAVGWAQNFARINREIMMKRMIDAVRNVVPKQFVTDLHVVNCHHNYINREFHFGKDVWVTRKGAVRAGKEDWGIIPGSMGAKSFIVQGKGNKDSFETCSHGAGRLFSRSEAKRRFTIDDHKKDTKGVECRKDKSVIDETPRAYKPIENVMKAQSDLVEIKYTLKQIVCVKG